MSKTEETLNPKTPYQDLTIGGNIYTAGNAKEFKTGDWRSQKPVWISEKCKQCGLCWPVCPDDAIPVHCTMFTFNSYEVCIYLTVTYESREVLRYFC